MCKKIVLLGVLLSGLFILTAYAQEQITVTTYYPSPYGSYNQLQTNRLAVGGTNADQPNRDGDIRITPQPGDPGTWPAGTVGQFSYSSAKDALYHYNGSAWVPQSGGGCYVSYSGGCLAGFTNKGPVGTYGYCITSCGGASCTVINRPPGGGCPPGWSAGPDSGMALACCQ